MDPCFHALCLFVCFLLNDRQCPGFLANLLASLHQPVCETAKQLIHRFICPIRLKVNISLQVNVEVQKKHNVLHDFVLKTF